MSALLIILFVLGIVVGLIVSASNAPQQRQPHAAPKATKLDTTDEMFLYGEVNQDDFYRM